MISNGKHIWVPTHAHTHRQLWRMGCTSCLKKESSKDLRVAWRAGGCLPYKHQENVYAADARLHNITSYFSTKTPNPVLLLAFGTIKTGRQPVCKGRSSRSSNSREPLPIFSHFGANKENDLKSLFQTSFLCSSQ